MVLEVTPGMLPSLHTLCQAMKQVLTKSDDFTPVYIKQVTNVLQLCAIELTIHCYEYFVFERCLQVAMKACYGIEQFEISVKCSSYKSI